MTDFVVSPQDWAELREDVGFIRAHIETINARLDEHDREINTMTKTAYTLGSIGAVFGSVVGHFIK